MGLSLNSNATQLEIMQHYSAYHSFSCIGEYSSETDMNQVVAFFGDLTQLVAHSSSHSTTSLRRPVSFGRRDQVHDVASTTLYTTTCLSKATAATARRGCCAAAAAHRKVAVCVCCWRRHWVWARTSSREPRRASRASPANTSHQPLSGFRYTQTQCKRHAYAHFCAYVL